MNKIEQLRKNIRDAADQIARIQEECCHPASCLESKQDSNTGNYDPSADCSWVDYTCTLCGKTWRTYDK
jgi:hypothetical protein